MNKLTAYPRIIELPDLTLKLVPDNEKFERIPNRLFYKLVPHKSGVEVWKRTDQGTYNLMASNGYLVSYIDNAKVLDEY